MNDDLKKLAEMYGPKETKVLPNTRQLSSVRFTPCGRFLVGAGFDSLVHRWDASGDEFGLLPPIEGHGGWVQEVVFHPTNEWVYSADSWGRLQCASYTALTSSLRWSVPAAHDGWIEGLASSSDGSLVATAGIDRKVRVWSASDGRKLHEFSEHADPVLRLGFHPDGKSLISGDLKGRLCQWDLTNGKLLREFDGKVLFNYHRLQDVGGVRSLAFNADGSLLACGGTRPANGGNVQGIPTVLLFETATGELKQTLELGQSGDVYAYDLRFHPAGFLMVVTSGNPGAGKLMFRRLEDAEPFFLTTKMANCHSLSLHPDGTRLAVAATNTGSNGNGRNLDKNGQYVGNFSPVYILDITHPPALKTESSPGTGSR
jgi:hypothetical protein